MEEHKRKLLAAYKSSNFHTFEEYLIDQHYYNSIKISLISSDIAKAFNKIGDLEREFGKGGGCR